MIDDVTFDMGCPITVFDQGGSLPDKDTTSVAPVDERVFGLRSSQRILRGSFFQIDPSTARREDSHNSSHPVIRPDERITSTAIKAIERTVEKPHAPSDKRKYTHKEAGFGGYLLGIGEMLLGGTLMVTGAAIEVGSFGTLTVAVGFQEAAGFALITDGFTRTLKNRDISYSSKKHEPIYNPNDFLSVSKGERKSSDEPGSPPVRGDSLVGDGTTTPGYGFDEWKGKGSPESNRGSWVRGIGEDKESLHQDFNHPVHDPHWDYEGPNFPEGARLYPDGTWEPK